MGRQLIVTPAYEERLDSDWGLALSEGSKYFAEKGGVQEALQKIAHRLNELGIPYVIAGGMALFKHGLRRFTEDVDIIVTAEGLKTLHSKLEGFGYRPPFNRSKNLRDTELGVRIEFLVTGEYPGDGKPKPVSFPDPYSVSIEQDGIRFLNLPSLVELKLASGMTNPGRMKDLSDVLELIKILNLPANFSDQLNPYVREKYDELWQNGRRRYVQIWRNKFLTLGAQNLDEMIITLQHAVELLKAMQADGVTLDPEGGASDDYAYLITSDPDVAKKYDMHAEEDFWDGAEDVDTQIG